jgi:hypothetical protein
MLYVYMYLRWVSVRDWLRGYLFYRGSQFYVRGIFLPVGES